MAQTRRMALAAMFGSTLAAAAVQDAQDQDPATGRRKEPFPALDGDTKPPNGKSQRDAIAQQQHAQALKAAGELVDLAQQVKSDLEKAGNYVVPVSTMRKTEEIEKLARRIRGRLKD